MKDQKTVTTKIFLLKFNSANINTSRQQISQPLGIDNTYMLLALTIGVEQLRDSARLNFKPSKRDNKTVNYCDKYMLHCKNKRAAHP